MYLRYVYQRFLNQQLIGIDVPTLSLSTIATPQILYTWLSLRHVYQRLVITDPIHVITPTLCISTTDRHSNPLRYVYQRLHICRYRIATIDPAFHVFSR